MTVLEIIDEQETRDRGRLVKAFEIARQYRTAGQFAGRSASELRTKMLEEHSDLSVADVTIAIDVVGRMQPPNADA